jgi:hypothetical protein
MKNRKTVVVAFLLVAVLLLGVGYAALSDTLTIIGNAVIDMEQAEDNFEAKVYFSHAEFTKHGSGDETKDTFGGIDTDDATFSIHSLATKGESATVVFTIKNESNVPVKIDIPEKKLSGDTNQSNTNPTVFGIEYKYSRNDMTIPAGETMTVTITVTVKAPVTSATGATFGIEFTATTAE